MVSRLTLVAVATLALAAPVRAANWSLALHNHVVLTPPVGVNIEEMSGVTYLGPVAGGLHRFLTVQEGHASLTQFDLAFSATGDISGISNVTSIAIPNFTQDFEGIAYSNPARNSAFVSDESPAGPNIRELNLATGTSYQALTIPSVIKDNERPNRGFESLTRTLDGTAMWAANEQALTVDGAESTPASGTTVRLVKFNVAGNTATAGPQFAYQVEPIHSATAVPQTQSGLSDLTAMPDGTLLALERSLAGATPAYLTRIYEVGLAGATDVSVRALGNGLLGQSFIPVGKQSVFSNSIDGASGQNMEGLALGPKLANGSWVLVGVVDDSSGGDPFSQNTIVAFVATSNVTGDFDHSGKANGADFLAWQRGLGKTLGATLAEGDGDRDGDVDAADLAIWKAANATAVNSVVPEPTAALLLGFAMTAIFAPRRRRLDCFA